MGPMDLGNILIWYHCKHQGWIGCPPDRRNREETQKWISMTTYPITVYFHQDMVGISEESPELKKKHGVLLTLLGEEEPKNFCRIPKKKRQNILVCTHVQDRVLPALLISSALSNPFLTMWPMLDNAGGLLSPTDKPGNGSCLLYQPASLILSFGTYSRLAWFHPPLMVFFSTFSTLNIVYNKKKWGESKKSKEVGN